ncbi:phage tail sheath subtilisin-like domain-containing protein [Streptomyces sp. NPDC097981]|uniref:phage tail sheath family protein n=1 Tax=Streptomyces sp. NPDC097981 TaxID=3155428 RepID=UPI0033211E43
MSSGWPIAGAGTSTAGFIAPLPEDFIAPRLVRSWREFADTYGTGAGGDQKPAKATLAEAVYGFFANGGGKCFVAGTTGDGLAAYTSALTALETVPDVHMVVVPELWKSEADAPAIAKAVAGHCVRTGNRMALLHTQQGVSVEDVAKTPGLFGLDETEAQFSAVYYPWVEVPGIDGTARVVPPSGHVAGIWARTDAERGVFKAPANCGVRGATGVATAVTDAEQGPANEAGVNCLRVFPDRGLLVWGARTLSTARDWKYVNVRRLVNFLNDSIRQSSTWAVFETDNEQLRAKLKQATSTFLTDQWRQGALMGSTLNEAFYVICDDTNNTSETDKEGHVLIDIGIAPIRPAEFIQFRVTQVAGAQE